MCRWPQVEWSGGDGNWSWAQAAHTLLKSGAEWNHDREVVLPVPDRRVGGRSRRSDPAVKKKTLGGEVAGRKGLGWGGLEVNARGRP